MIRRPSAARSVLAGAALLLFGSQARGLTVLEIHDIGDSGTTKDLTIFEAEPNPTSPSTGTGVFEPFVRIQGSGAALRNGNGQNPSQGPQQGFNTDSKEPDINFNAKGGKWTTSITLGDAGTVTRNGTRYLEFALDANEPGRVGSVENLIDITDIQLFVGPNLADPESLGLGTSFLANGQLDLGANANLIWRLDNAVNGDVTVELAASICDAPGQCGSGHGDMRLLIPVSALDLSKGYSLSDNLVFYSSYDRAGGATGGFEEWRRGTGPPIPEPTAALVFAVGAAIVGGVTQRMRRA